MDTEEDLKLKAALSQGTPETDEGPYYHDSWWESYKGSVKGKLGGVIIGAIIGAVVGGAAVAIIALLSPISIPVGAAMVAGFAAAGVMYGEHEFSEIGKITGAVAAAHETSEQRMKTFENGKFSELKNEIGELKAMISGKATAADGTSMQASPKRAAPSDYRTTHCDDHCEVENRKWVYWKVAAMGLLVGAAAGSILAFGALATPAIAAMSAAGTITGVGVYTASVVSMGLFGASFGINRDIFRHVFDKTDLWFKGVFERKNGGHVADVKLHHDAAAKAPSEVTTLVSDNFVAYPSSDTYHRDRVLAAAEKALLSFDHTRATPQ
jgi:hypothetical protein